MNCPVCLRSPSGKIGSRVGKSPGLGVSLQGYVRCRSCGVLLKNVGYERRLWPFLIVFVAAIGGGLYFLGPLMTTPLNSFVLLAAVLFVGNVGLVILLQQFSRFEQTSEPDAPVR